MFLGLDNFGLSFLQDSFFIPKKSYNKVLFKSNTTVDATNMTKLNLTAQEIQSINSESYFDMNSVYVANMNGNTQGGNYTVEVDPIAQWLLRRKQIGTFNVKTLATLDKEVSSFIDYTNANNVQYEYELYPLNSQGVWSKQLKTEVESNFFGWYLSNMESTKSYRFYVELDTGEISLNLAQKFVDNFTQYPTVLRGKSKYHSGTIKTMPLSYNGNEAIFSYNLLKEIESFISEDSIKYLRNTKGDIWRVKTGDFKYSYVEFAQSVPISIQFNFIEVESDD